MPLIKTTLVNALKSSGFSDDAANAVATAIDAYIKTATVTVTVTTTGTAAAQSGGGTGSLS